MNKNIKLVLATLGIVLGAGCVEAGTWVNGVYINGPLCTVCDGMRVVQHAYGTATCTHCDGTGIEPPPETYVETVVVDRWCPPPPPPRYHHPIHHRPAPPPPRHQARPAPHGGRPAPRPVGRAPRGGGAPRHGGGARPGRR